MSLARLMMGFRVVLSTSFASESRPDFSRANDPVY
jgi:hypothetical protein